MFLLFAGHDYYPKGGIKDLKYAGSYQECVSLVKKTFAIENKYENEHHWHWAQICSMEPDGLICIDDLRNE